MKADHLIAGRILDPVQLKLIYAAFDGAWEIIRPMVPRNKVAQEAARLKLANALLGIELSGSLDMVQLRNQALKLYRGEEGYTGRRRS